MKIYVVTRLTPYTDYHLYKHFFNYYKKMNVAKFLINFNSKVDNEETINKFIKTVLEEFGNLIIYNIGPNGINTNETSNIEKLKQLVKENTNEDDLILTTDCDEFHYIPIDLKKLELYDFDYIKGFTIERTSYNFKLINITDNCNIFNNFPFHMNELIIPKVSLCKKQIFLNNIDVGHHNVHLKPDDNFKKYYISSYVNHFRWSAESKDKRFGLWHKLWKDVNYKGWKPSSEDYINKRIYTFENLKDQPHLILIDDKTKNKDFDISKLDKFFKYKIYSGENLGANDFMLIVVDIQLLISLNKTYFNDYDNLDYHTVIPFVYCYEINNEIKFIKKIDLYFQQLYL